MIHPADSEEERDKSDGDDSEKTMAVKDDPQFTLAVTRDRHVEKESLADYISKKREMFLVQVKYLSLSGHRTGILAIVNAYCTCWLGSILNLSQLLNNTLSNWVRQIVVECMVDLDQTASGLSI